MFRVTPREKVIKELEGVSMDLTLEQAEVLRAIFHNISGNPKTTDRGVIDQINRGLKEAGINLPKNYGNYGRNYLTGSISFRKQGE